MTTDHITQLEAELARQARAKAEAQTAREYATTQMRKARRERDRLAAVMPQALAERAILAGCKPGGTVLDPFSGSGTTGMAATKHGRKYVGIDLSSDYLDLSLRTRFAQPGLDLSGESA